MPCSTTITFNGAAEPIKELRDFIKILAWPDDFVGSESEGSFSISTETASVPMLQMWRIIADKFSEDIEIVYTAEEPGTAVYISNDPAVAGDYVVDVYGNYQDKDENFPF